MGLRDVSGLDLVERLQPILDVQSSGLVAMPRPPRGGVGTLVTAGGAGQRATLQILSNAPGGIVIHHIRAHSTGGVEATNYARLAAPALVVVPGAVTLQNFGEGELLSVVNSGNTANFAPPNSPQLQNIMGGNLGQAVDIFVPPGAFFILQNELNQQSMRASIIWSELPAPLTP